MDDLDLARYQSALLTLFTRKDIDDEDRMRILRADPAFAPYASYVGTFERRFVALGANILASYARQERQEEPQPKR